MGVHDPAGWTARIASDCISRLPDPARPVRRMESGIPGSARREDVLFRVREALIETIFPDSDSEPGP